jgi:hypothetical protein
MTYDEMREAFGQQHFWVIERLKGVEAPRLYGPFPTESDADAFYDKQCAILRADGMTFLLSIAADGRRIWS